MTVKHPTFIVRNNSYSAYFFRTVIPKNLRSRFNGIREVRISLKTGIVDYFVLPTSLFAALHIDIIIPLSLLPSGSFVQIK